MINVQKENWRGGKDMLYNRDDLIWNISFQHRVARFVLPSKKWQVRLFRPY
jgi:hypothetical protein